MRKLLMSLSVLAGILFAGTLPASANAAAGLTSIQVQKPATDATKVHWRGGGWGWGGPRFYFGFGSPYYGYGYYPRYSYYDGGYGYPRYYGWRRHHYWGHRHWRRW